MLEHNTHIPRGCRLLTTRCRRRSATGCAASSYPTTAAGNYWVRCTSIPSHLAAGIRACGGCRSALASLAEIGHCLRVNGLAGRWAVTSSTMIVPIVNSHIRVPIPCIRCICLKPVESAGRLEVLFDSGVRSGRDVFKALCLGVHSHTCHHPPRPSLQLRHYRDGRPQRWALGGHITGHLRATVSCVPSRLVQDSRRADVCPRGRGGRCGGGTRHVEDRAHAHNGTSWYDVFGQSCLGTH